MENPNPEAGRFIKYLRYPDVILQPKLLGPNVIQQRFLNFISER